MKLKTALVLVFALTFQPSFAASNSTWYDDPLMWATISTAAVTSYFVGGKLRQGIKTVLPAMLGSTLVWGLGAFTAVSRRFDRSSVTVLFSVVLLGTVLIYKSVITCPRTGHAGCTCGLKAGI